MISVIIPSRDRPEQLLRAIQNVRDTTPELDVEIIAVVDEPDTVSQEAAYHAGVRVVVMPPTYVHGNPQQKFQAGYEAALGDWIVSGSDDILFAEGWLKAALAWPNKGYVGLCEDYFKSDLAVLVMASRDYIETVMGGEFGLPYYHVWFSDCEWRDRAIAAGVYTVCPEARFEHLHYLFGKGPRDGVAALSEQFHREDEATYIRRLAAGFPKENV
jgi:glycosyltransferase involved in cell wall biosynthesis